MLRSHRLWLFLLLAFFEPAIALADDYKLGPEDQLQITVFDMRQGSQAYQWTPFNIPFRVDASGKISLPLIGSISVLGKTTADLAEVITTKLQARVGLAMKPDASIQILKYRPFYILGSVEKPGAYEYAPGLTVLQAVSIAGGLSQPTPGALLGFERDALSNQGDVRVLSRDRLSLLMRQARLDAEIEGSNSIKIPPEVDALIKDKDIARLVDEQQKLFEARGYSLKSQTAALEESKTVLQNQLLTLQEKDATLVKQLNIVKQELNQVSGLVSKGLAVLPRQLEIEQNEAQFESSRLDIQLAIGRTQQDLSTAERSILELNNTARDKSLQEAADVRNQLEENGERLKTANNLLQEAEIRDPSVMQAEDEALENPKYVITRVSSDGATSRPVQESDPVMPGDVVRVEPAETNSIHVKDGGISDQGNTD